MTSQDRTDLKAGAKRQILDTFDAKLKLDGHKLSFDFD